MTPADIHLANRISDALELDYERVIRTPHGKLLKMLVDKIDVLENDNKLKQDTLNDIDSFLERLR